MADDLSALEPLPARTTNSAFAGRTEPRPNRGRIHDTVPSRQSSGDRHTGDPGVRARLQPLPAPWAAGQCTGHHTVSCRLHPPAGNRVAPAAAEYAETGDAAYPTVAARGLPDYLVPIVAQLLTGATDVTASQRLGMSPRTFSRRVSELLEYLGVMSRFQAGVAAVNQGWLVQRPHPPVRKH